MKTAKLFMNGKSQAVRLPKEYRFNGDEVGIRKVGEVVVLFPKDTAWDAYLRTEPVCEDFGDVILAARHDNKQNEREPL